MEGLKPPTELCFDGNVSENWRKWKRSFDNYLLAINLVTTPAGGDGVDPPGNAAIRRRQLAILLHTAGEEANEVYSQLDFANDNEKVDYKIVVQKFQDYCNPRRNIMYEWFVFWNLKQLDGENIDTYAKRLKIQASLCEFGDLKDQMLLFRVIFGITDSKLKERLLRDTEMTLARALNDVRATEMTRKQLSSIADGDKTSVAVVSKHSASFVSRDSLASAAVEDKPSLVSSCRYCGYDHPRGKCPAYGKTCKKCGKKNHFIARCSVKEVNEIADDPGNAMTSLYIGAIDNSGSDCWRQDVQLGPSSLSVSFKLDTGAETNILPKSIVDKIGCDLQPTQARLMGYGNHHIPTVGKISLDVKHGDICRPFEFEVIDSSAPPILGLQALDALDLVRRVENVTSTCVLEEFPQVFEGIGCVAGEHRIKVDDSVQPVVHAARRVPVALLDRVKAQLQSMENDAIVTRVDEPTPWVNSMVIVEKSNGDLRICLDPKDLNKAVLREHHKIPTIQDIALKFQGMDCFTILDMRHGYWHVPLSVESSLLTTFNTPFGRYRFLRLPFGLKSAAEVFEKRVEALFGDLPGVAMYFDDLVVAGKDRDEHDANLRRLLSRAAEVNVKFNRQKIQLAKSQVVFLGHVVSNVGMKPDPMKIKAISEMPAPVDKEGVQRLLGTVNYLGSYIPNLATMTQPLRVLLKSDALFSWDFAQSEAFENIKKVLVSEPVLSYFNPSKSVVVQVDASKSGLGAVLLQEGHPVCYASRSLTPAELNYAPIEKELLAVVFGCEKFHTYVYGRTVHIQTDHKPLVSIISNPTSMASPRLQRLLLRLEKYPEKVTTHVPGKELYLADTLSRAYLPITDDDKLVVEDDKVLMVHFLTADQSLTDELVTGYREDREMIELRNLINQGWPNIKRSVPNPCKVYWAVKDTLHIEDDFLYVGERLVIPSGSRVKMLESIHQGHLGVQKCLDRARQSVYWPGLTRDVEEYVEKCSICSRFRNRQQKEPLLPHAIPSLPWQKVAMDILEFQGKNFLVVIDFMSHFPELRLLTQKRAQDVIMALKSIFSLHGVPQEIFADNMPFSSSTMHSFAEEWGFQITTSSPNYPRSNGLAERYVQTVKAFLKKADESQSDVYSSLLVYRDTPVSGMLYSPAELLFNRQLRTKLPKHTNILTPQVPDSQVQLEARQLRAKAHYDRTTKSLEPLKEGDPVLVRTDKEKTWEPDVVAQLHGSPRSYILGSGLRNRGNLPARFAGFEMAN